MKADIDNAHRKAVADNLTVGTMVYYELAEGLVRPAIIVHVWDEDSGYGDSARPVVQLQVFLDGLNDRRELMGLGLGANQAAEYARRGLYWATSVSYAPNGGKGTWRFTPHTAAEEMERMAAADGMALVDGGAVIDVKGQLEGLTGPPFTPVQLTAIRHEAGRVLSELDYQGARSLLAKYHDEPITDVYPNLEQTTLFEAVHKLKQDLEPTAAAD